MGVCAVLLAWFPLEPRLDLPGRDVLGTRKDTKLVCNMLTERRYMRAWQGRGWHTHHKPYVYSFTYISVFARMCVYPHVAVKHAKRIYLYICIYIDVHTIRSSLHTKYIFTYKCRSVSYTCPMYMIHTCMCFYIYIYMSIYTCTHVIHIYVYIYIHLCMYTSIYACMQIHICVYVHIHTLLFHTLLVFLASKNPRICWEASLPTVTSPMNLKVKLVLNKPKLTLGFMAFVSFRFLFTLFPFLFRSLHTTQ